MTTNLTNHTNNSLPNNPLIPAKAGTQAGLAAAVVQEDLATKNTKNTNGSRARDDLSIGRSAFVLFVLFVLFVFFVVPLELLPAWVPAFAGMSGSLKREGWSGGFEHWGFRA